MYIVIGSTTYSIIKNLSFDPETDVTGSEVPVNQFVVDVITTDTIDTGSDIYLYDDTDVLWAKFWLIDAYRLDENTVRITAQSLLAVLDRYTLPAAIYSSATLASVVAEIFATVSAIYGSTVIYEIDSSFDSDVVTGYAPQQTARERLQWVLMCIGAYCKQVFTDHLQFLPISDVLTEVPMNQVYYRPEIAVADYVTAVTVIAYSYTAGTPVTTDEYVKVNGTTYIQSSTSFTLANTDAPATAPENIITVDDVYLINEDNVSEVLSRLSTYYFMRGEVNADIINNAQFAPGQRVWLPVSKTTAYAGFIRTMDFTFGTQAKCSILLTQTEDINLVELNIQCVYGETVLREMTYYLPEEYLYIIEMKYIETFNANNHVVYYPESSEITGTLTQATTVTVNYYVALDQHFGTKVLTIYSADEVTQETEDGEVVLTIS